MTLQEWWDSEAPPPKNTVLKVWGCWWFCPQGVTEEYFKEYDTWTEAMEAATR